MRIAQINAQRSRVVAAEMAKNIKDLNIDILCIQEPYAYKNDIRGYPTSEMTSFKTTVDNAWVAVVVKNENLEIFHIAHLDTAHMMCFQVISNAEEFYIINAYCQFSLPLDQILKSIDEIISKLNINKLVITMDANAKSDMWHSGETDDKGREVEDFIFTNNLYILNKPNNPPTFSTGYAESNIDITLASENMLKFIKDWRVIEHSTTSDHNLIIFDVCMQIDERRKIQMDDKYNLGKANWDCFRRELDARATNDFIEAMKHAKPNNSVKLLNKNLKYVCEKSIPKKRKCNRSTPWWNEELAALRQKLVKAKKNLARVRRLQIIEQYENAKECYVQRRNCYVNKIKKAKRDSWRQFVDEETSRDLWGIPYKIVRDKIKKTEIITSLMKEDGTTTSSFDETMSVLMNKCVPSDDISIENPKHRQIRDKVNSYTNSNMDKELEYDDIDKAIKKLKNKTAPGVDNFNPEIIKELWKEQPALILNLLNNCWKSKVFPDIWKMAKLKIILKNGNKDKKVLGSYRPISLIFTLGKIFERIMVDKIEIIYKAADLEEENQYGFRKGKSTEDAILHLRNAITESSKKYMVTLFVDIQGAFDNLWWPAIKARLIEANISYTLMTLIKSYFKKRKVIIQAKNKFFYKYMEKGCPQGSILGLAAWNWCMDSLLAEIRKVFLKETMEAIAYADDVVFLIKADSRKEIEHIARKTVTVLMDWCERHKLKISPNKTVAMLIKGKMNKDRNPIIKIDSGSIKFDSQVKYLGIMLDNRCNFISHAKYVRDKITSYISTIKRIAKQEWGIKAHERNILYNMVTIPIITYASAAWYDKANHVMVRRHLLAAQRTLLLMNTRATRTTSTVALQVIAGAKPLDLELTERGLKGLVRRNNAVMWNDYKYEVMEEFQKWRIVDESKRIEFHIQMEWQKRWNQEEHGRHTYGFIKELNFAILNKWFTPCRECVYIITGYGPIRSTLFKRGAEASNTCPACNNKEETVTHMLLECPAYNSIRYKGLEKLEENPSSLIKTQDEYGQLRGFSHKLFKLRNTYL